MSLLLPQFLFGGPSNSRCGPARYQQQRRQCGPAGACGPARFQYHRRPQLWNVLEDTIDEIARASQQAQRTFAPNFDVHETSENYTLEGEVPGVEQSSLAIEFVDESTLKVTGHTGSGSEAKPPAYEDAQTEKAATEPEATPAADTESTHTLQATVEDAAEGEWVDVNEKGEKIASTSSEKQPEQAAATAPTSDEKQKQKEKETTPAAQPWLSERHHRLVRAHVPLRLARRQGGRHR